MNSLQLSQSGRLILRRHSDYVRDLPVNGWGNATAEESSRLGHITDDGVQSATSSARPLIKDILDHGDGNTCLLVVASPTHWLSDMRLGQRAVETAEIYSSEVSCALKERGMPPQRLLNSKAKDTIRYPRASRVRVAKRLQEAQIFDTPGAYDAISELRAKYGGQGDEFWNAWYMGENDGLLESVGAEISVDAANRASKEINRLLRFIQFHSNKCGCTTVVLAITHHEILQAYAIHKLGIPASVFKPGYNEGFEIILGNHEKCAKIAERTVIIGS